MLCLEIERNGRRLCRAGVVKGVTSAIWSWVSRDAKTPIDDLGAGDVVPGFDCRVGGLDTVRPNREEFVDWTVLHDVRLGDEFTIRIGRAAKVDRPAERRRSDVERATQKGIKKSRCSFCRRWRPVQRPSGSPEFMRGIDVVICRNCVGVAQTMVERRSRAALHFKLAADARCWFCVRPRPKVVVAAKAGVCLKCLANISGGL